MAERGARLVDGGFPVVPIIPGAKCPGRYAKRHGWRGMTGWCRYCDRLPTATELAIWGGWPGCGIGIPGGRVAAVDIDVTDGDLALRIEALARAELGDTPALRIGRRPKRLLVYRAEQPFRKFARHPIEIIARGAQFVAYAVHPDTGEPYRWPVDDLSELELSSLPAVREEQCRRFLDAATALLPAELRQGRLGPDPHREVYYAPAGELRGTVEAVTAALAFVPNDDLHYDDWIRVGHALKGGLGEAGRPLFEAWSAGSSKDVPATTAKAWRSFRPNRIGAGTIYGHALERGWVPDGGLILNGAVAEAAAAGIHPAADFLAGAGPRRAPGPDEGPAPEADGSGAPPGDGAEVAALVAEAPGLLGEIARWMVATAVSPQPFLSLAAALCAVGAAAGRRFRLETPDTRSNVYVIVLGDSASGKDHPRKCTRRLLIEAGLAQHLGGETIASGAGLLSSVAKHPVRLFQIDEFGHFVAAVLDPQSHAHHRREIMTQLTTLFTSATEMVVGTEYSNQTERPRVDICEPCVCVYGATVQQPFWAAMQHGHISDGSLPRFLVFQSERNYPDERDPEPVEARLPGLAARLAAVAAGDGSLGSLVAACVKPTLREVPLDDGARERDRALRERQLGLKRRHEGTPFAAIVGRLREHVRRLALVAAVAVDPARPVVTAAEYGWAERVADHCVATVLEQARRFVADSPHEALSKRVLEIIRRAGATTAGGWVDGHTLAERVRFVTRKVRQEVVAELVEAGLVEARTESTATKPRHLVRAVPG